MNVRTSRRLQQGLGLAPGSLRAQRELQTPRNISAIEMQISVPRADLSTVATILADVSLAGGSVHCDGSNCANPETPPSFVFGTAFFAALTAATGLSVADLAPAIEYEAVTDEAASQSSGNSSGLTPTGGALISVGIAVAASVVFAAWWASSRRRRAEVVPKDAPSQELAAGGGSQATAGTGIVPAPVTAEIPTSTAANATDTGAANNTTDTAPNTSDTGAANNITDTAANTTNAGAANNATDTAATHTVMTMEEPGGTLVSKQHEPLSPRAPLPVAGGENSSAQTSREVVIDV